MNIEPRPTPVEVRRFSADEWQSCELFLWQQTEEIATQIEGFSEQADRLYEETTLARSGNLHNQEVADKKEKTYWELQVEIDSRRGRETDIFMVLEKFEDGTVTEEDVLPLLPEPEQPEEEKLSKRRQAIARQKAREGEEAQARRMRLLALGVDLDFLTGDTGQANGTRLGTGRNLRKLKSARALDPEVAIAEFHHSTADTHGGKVNPGTSKNYYVRNGRRIRKR